MSNFFSTQGWLHMAALAGVAMGLGGVLLPYLLWGGDDIITIVLFGLGGAYLALRCGLWAVQNYRVDRRKGPRRRRE